MLLFSVPCIAYNNIINKLNIEFHSEKTKIYVLLTRVTELYRMMLKSLIKSDYMIEK